MKFIPRVSKPPLELGASEERTWSAVLDTLSEIAGQVEICGGRIEVICKEGKAIWICVDQEGKPCGEWACPGAEGGEASEKSEEIFWAVEIVLPKEVKKEEMEHLLQCCRRWQVQLPGLILEDGIYRGFVRSEALTVAIVF